MVSRELSELQRNCSAVKSLMFILKYVWSWQSKTAWKQFVTNYCLYRYADGTYS